MPISKWLGAAVLLVLFTTTGRSQQLKLGNNPYGVEKSAVLELQSANQGLLFPRIADTALINAMAPPDGMVIYFTPTRSLLLRANGYWQALAPDASLSNYWSIEGNSNGAEKKLGTADNFALPFITNNTERMRITNTGNVGIGTSTFDASNAEKLLVDAGNTSSFNVISGKGSINNYLQLNIQNRSNGNTASSDIVATADNGSESVNFIDLGINSSGFSNTAYPILNGINNAYLYSTGNDFMIGNATSGKNLRLFTGGYATANERMRIDGNGRIGMGVTAPTAIVHLKAGTTSANTAPLKFTSGSLLTTAEAGAVEFNSDKFYGTITTGAARKEFTLNDAALTAGRLPVTTTNGRLTSNANLVWDNTNSRLGIGSTSPTEALDMTGNLRLNGAFMPNNSAGSTGQLLASNGAGAAPSWITPGYLTSVDTGDIANFYQKVRSEFAAAGPVTYNNGLIGITQATGSTNGYLSSTDWTTFNNKLSSVDTGDIANFSVKVRGLFSAGSGITYNAATGVLSAIGSSDNWLYGGNTVTALKNFGTVDNFDLPFITNNTEKMRLTAAGKLGIGTAAPNNVLEVTGTNTGTGVSGLRLTNLGTATVAAANSKVLSVNASGDVIVTNNPAASNWLMTGNAGINASTNFLGTTDDKQMILKSNNQSFLEFGRRQTLGLTQGYTDYDDNDEKVTYVRSALQFEAPAANFYKPKMFTDANGNFRVKGSSAGTDYFEFGSTGTNNNGGFEFIIGDDGDEPILFKSYHYINGMSEIMRLQSGRMAVGSNAFDATNPEKLLIDAGNTTSYNLMTGKGSIDNYLQINVQNRSNGGSASSDLVATSNNGSETTNFIDMGINSGGYTNNSYPILNGANNAYLYSTGNDMIMGNGTTGKSFRFFTGGFNLANERMRIDGNGKVGIGTTTPSEVLDVIGNLELSGAFMPGGSAGTAGYVLTSNGAGAAPTWTSAAGTGWSLNGNNVTSIKTLGTTSNYDLPFITNNTEKMRLSSTGNLAIGTSTFDGTAPERLLIDAGDNNTSYNLVVARGDVNNYLQFNIQNQNAGNQASTDIVATANNGTEAAKFIDMGINSSGYSNSGILGGAGNAYLYSTGNDLIIGNATATASLRFFTGGTGTGNERLRVDPSGKVGVNTTSPQAAMDVNGSYKLGASGTVLSNMIKSSVSFTDNTSFNYTTTNIVTVSVTGAAVNGSVIVNPRSSLPNGIGIGWARVTSVNTIAIGFTNTDTSSRTIGSVTLDITVIQ